MAAVTTLVAGADHHRRRTLHNACCNATRSSRYRIKTGRHTHADGWCDVTPDGQGWLTILRRVNSPDDTSTSRMHYFDKSFSEYEEGFGDLSSNNEFWYGLKLISDLTNKQQYELRIDFYNSTSDNQSVDYVTYNDFRIGSVCENYTLHLNNFSRSNVPNSKLLDSLSMFNNQEFIGFETNSCNYRGGKGGWWFRQNVCITAGGVPGSVLTFEFTQIHWNSESNQPNVPDKLKYEKYELKIKPKEC